MRIRYLKTAMPVDLHWLTLEQRNKHRAYEVQVVCNDHVFMSAVVYSDGRGWANTLDGFSHETRDDAAKAALRTAYRASAPILPEQCAAIRELLKGLGDELPVSMVRAAKPVAPTGADLREMDSDKQPAAKDDGIGTCRDLGAWIWKHVPPLNREDFNLGEDAACWFVAYQTAQDYSDASTKDWARTLLAGTPPIDSAYVDDWLGDLLNDDYDMDTEAENQAVAQEQLVDRLREFWGLQA